MLRDRGTIKWNSLMLPEHVEILKDMWKDDQKAVAPQLDEQALEELNERCVQAYQEETIVSVTQIKNGAFCNDRGTIIKLVPQEQAIRLKRLNGKSISIPIQHIVQLDTV